MSAMTLKVNSLQDHFLQLIDAGKLSHAYLFLGQSQDQIHNFIAALAAEILHENSSENVFENGQLMQVDLLTGKKTLSVDQMRELQIFFSEKSSQARIAVIDHADQMTDAAANSILKLIEEPFDNQYFFFQAAVFNQILPTILSRVQLIQMPKTFGREVQSRLVADGLSQEDAAFVSAVSTSLEEAQTFLLAGFAINLKNAIDKWLSMILTGDYRVFAFVQTDLITFADTIDHQRLFAAGVSYGLSHVLKQQKDTKTADILACWLDISSRQRFNVAWQVILETFALEALRISDGTKKFSDK